MNDFGKKKEVCGRWWWYGRGKRGCGFLQWLVRWLFYNSALLSFCLFMVAVKFLFVVVRCYLFVRLFTNQEW